ncbi:MAG: hypothetical protein IPO66_16345 [Rhodanobacteraceae bacterium]|nr:hypothetical protein [Rhodanobacteraceae bacterium]
MACAPAVVGGLPDLSSWRSCLITALAAPLLGERVGANRWWAIVKGLVGVLVVLRPSGTQMLSLGGMAVLGSTLCYAISAITRACWVAATARCRWCSG